MSTFDIDKLKQKGTLTRVGSIGIDKKSSSIIYRNPQTGEILKKDDPEAVGYRRFWAMISTEQVDSERTIIDRNGVVAAFFEWMDANGGNVRYMHAMEPVGRIFKDDYEVRDAGVYAGISIPLSETEVLRKIDAGLIRFVSIGFNIRWEAKDAIEEIKDGLLKINRLTIVELSIGDFGATPGTEIQEERNSGGDSLLKKIYNMIKGSGKIDKVAGADNEDDDPGATPMNTTTTKEDDEMTPEQFKELLKAQEVGFAKLGEKIEGALKPLTRVAEEQPPEKKENENTNDTDTLKPILDQMKAMEQRIADLQKNFTTEDSLPVSSIAELRTMVEAEEKRIADLKKEKENDPNRLLSFIQTSEGKPLTVERLMGRGE